MSTVPRTVAQPTTPPLPDPLPLSATAPGRIRLRALMTLVRPGQWPKNLIAVPLPLLDTASWSVGTLGRIGWSVVAFVLASSLVYVFNDIADRHRDREHPVKRLRPIASGRVGVTTARLFAVTLAVLLAGLLATQPFTLWWPVPFYLLLNVAYSRRLKHVPLVDVFVVAAGFQLRLAQGYLATGEPVSGWLLACALAGCLLLILGKRRHELGAYGGTHRPALRGYSIPFLELLLGFNCLLAVTTFLLYLQQDALLGPYTSAAMLVSLPAVLFGAFRYLQLVIVHRDGGDPVRTLLRDRPLVGTAAVCLALFGVILAAARYPVLAELVAKVV